MNANAPTPSSWPSRVFLGAGALAAGGYFLAPHAVQSVGYIGFALAAVMAIAVGARRNRPARVSVWWLFAGGLLLFGMADGVLSFYELAFDEQPFPSVADAIYLGGYALLIAGLGVLIRSRATGANRAAMIDALIIAIGLGVVAWSFWMVQYTHDPSLSPLAESISLAYPLMDVVLLASVLRLALGPGQRAPAFHLLCLSLGFLLAADVAYGLTTLAGTYDIGSPVDAGYTLSYVLWGAAALHPSTRVMPAAGEAPEATLTRTRILALGAASLVGPAAIAIQSWRGASIDVPVTLAASAGAFILVLMRMSGLMRLLADTAAKRARAIERERTLRRAAAWLVGARDSETIFNVACGAVAAVVGGSARNRVTAWSGSVETATVVASAGSCPAAGPDPGDPNPLGEPHRDALLTGEPLELSPAGALGDVPADGVTGVTRLVVPLVLDGELVGGFAILSPAPLDCEVKNSVCTLRDQVALALESVRLAEDLHRRRGEERLAALVEHSSDVVTILDDRGDITYQTPSVRSVLGYDSGELTGTSLIDLVHPHDVARVIGLLSDASDRAGVSPPSEWRMRHRDGGWRQTENVVNNLRRDPNLGAIVIDTRDVTERKQLQDQLVHQAFHDDLTQLANRNLFRDRAERALAHSQGKAGCHAILLLDLDGFKTINDSLGHGAGDRILVEVADRLRDSCRRDDTASRLGGDEFAVLLEDVDGAGEATRAAERIASTLRRPFDLDGREVFLTASIGIAIKCGDEHDAGEILRNADIAMYMAKQRGKARCELFEVGMHRDVLQRLELESDLRRAVERNELFLHYQPIVDLKSGRTTGVEALVRWRHPGRGVVPPLEFIGAAEDTGLIVPIGRWVLHQACAQAQAWQQMHPGEPRLAMNVNLSGRQLHDPSLVDDVAAALRESGLPPDSLALEITETAMMNDVDLTIARLHELGELGVRIAIDDFGTGYSSFSYLRRFPVHVLKIAKPFIDDLATDDEVLALAHGIVELGHTVGLQVVAEGIETSDQAAHLRRMRCDLGQGFHFARPSAAIDVEQALARTRTAGLATAA